MDQTACKPGSVPPLAGRGGHSSGPAIAGRFSRPTRTTGPARPYRDQGPSASSLFGLAPSGACHAVPVTGPAVGSYPTLSPVPAAEAAGGLLSVALSLGSPPAGVTRRLYAVEPGLSSTPAQTGTATARPSGPGRNLIGGARRVKGRWGRRCAPTLPATDAPDARGSRHRPHRRRGLGANDAGRRG